jgi:hypothetical protein
MGGLGAAYHVPHECLARRNAETSAELDEGLKAGFAQSPLDQADVGAVKAGRVGERLL